MNSLPNISNISNVSSTFSIATPPSSQVQNQNKTATKDKDGKKDDVSLPKYHTDRKLALDKIIMKLRKVQTQQQTEMENENDIKSNDNKNVNKYFNGSKEPSKYYKNVNISSDVKSKSRSVSSPSPSYFYPSNSNHEMIPRHRNISLHSNVGKVASIDCSNNHINTNNDDTLKPNVVNGPKPAYGSIPGIEVSFNSDDTLTGSQCGSQSISQSLCNQSNLGSNVVDSNATIQENPDEVDELQKSFVQINIQSPNRRTNSNPVLQKNLSSHSNCLCPHNDVVSSSVSPTESMEMRRSKTHSSSGIAISDPSYDEHEYSYSCSPQSVNVIPRPSNTNNQTIKYSTSVSFGGDLRNNSSHKNYVSTEEAIEEKSIEESNNVKWRSKYHNENSSIVPRKPKSLFNESIYSSSGSSIGPLHNKRKIFSTILNRDHDMIIRDRLKKRADELETSINMKRTCSASTFNSRRVSISTYHVAQSIKETDSIYLKSDEHYNLSLPSMHLTTEGKVNQYYIIREIDSGSYGRVYLVYDEIINQYFACKVISKSKLKRNFRFTRLARRRNAPGGNDDILSDDEDPLEQIKREVAIFKNLTKHPNISLLVEVLDDAREDNIYMVFELCEKGKIMDIQVNKRVEPYTEEKARKYFRDIVLGLEYCHFKKIIHRDIKPDNLLLTANDKVKISDFGISYMFNESQEDATISNKNASPLFSPPEACSSDRKYLKGKAIDIWSLGVTLYSLVHGYCPFEDTNIINLCKKIEEDPVIYSPTISDDLKDLLSKMLQKDPDKRITIPDIKTHPWVTEHNTNPMLSTEENCIYEDITEEEIENAVQPAFMFVSKLLNKIKKGLTKNDEKKHGSKGMLNNSIGLNLNEGRRVSSRMKGLNIQRHFSLRSSQNQVESSLNVSRRFYDDDDIISEGKEKDFN